MLPEKTRLVNHESCEKKGFADTLYDKGFRKELRLKVSRERGVIMEEGFHNFMDFIFLAQPRFP